MAKVARDPPLQWIVYQMCQMYRCTPSELMHQNAEIVRQHYQIKKTVEQYANG